ncbi:MAG TPA: matrixin family metalloprotease [Polyangiaceae bacterium]|nr:matrixin family metalloprotease [Polyangiaceae bacterium]
MRASASLRPFATVVLGVSVSVATGRQAHAFCRTSTCPLPPNWDPADAGACVPADFVQDCQTLSPPISPLPLWWRNACVSYDVQEDASQQIPYDTADAIAAESFSKWTGTICANGSQVGRVSIDLRDFGPVECDLVQYNENQGNQHVIVFRDQGSPDFDSTNTLGLTTVTFDEDTGEIYDADVEINSSKTLSVTDPAPPDGYDFPSIMTHEAGHFLGMAHSVSTETTMYAQYMQGTTTKRILSADDMAGICTIYPPDGTRAVDPSVTASGFIQEDACDPTPRHGFQSQCAQPQKSSCSVAGSEAATSSAVLLVAMSGVGTIGAVRRGRRRWAQGERSARRRG